MSEEKNDPPDPNENTDTDTAPAVPSAVPLGAPVVPDVTTPQRPTNPLSRPTDAVSRPGFRAPSNSRTKAQKKRRKKKKR